MSAEYDALQRNLDLYELFGHCADGSESPETVSQRIAAFSRSEYAPDAQILSDLLLDTLFLYDSGVIQEEEEILAAQRAHLGRLICILLEEKCVFEQDAYERLEAPLLFAANLISDSKAFEKKHIRINTNLLYKQQKFNLFREENEGFSKLVTEVETFLLSINDTDSEEIALELLTNIQSLIGYFDLDPNRVLDILLQIAAAHLQSHWRFLLSVFKLSPWFAAEESTHDSEDDLPELSKRSGNRAAAQIQGFNFQNLRTSPEDDTGLMMLAALLIKEGLVKWQDLWAHLAPDDATLSKEKSAYQNRILDEVDKAKGRNALAMAGGLEEEPRLTQDTTMDDVQDTAGQAEEQQKDNLQKVRLLRALLSIGALPEALVVLGEFNFLLFSNSEIAQCFLKLLDLIVAPVWNMIRPQAKYPESLRTNLQQMKKIPEEPKYRDSALVLPPTPEIRHSLDTLASAHNAVFREDFFYDAVDSQLSLCSSCDAFETLVLPYLRMLGVQVCLSPSFCTKIARIGKYSMSQASDREKTSDLWRSVLRGNLLPALSLIEANPALVNDIFNLAKEFDTEARYALYGEWFTDSYRRIPELKVQFVKTEKETKSLLRRISKTNTKEYGRRLAKVSHSNPCIVLNIALNQIESYDNLVDVVIEASRYFTLLSFDVLVYIMLTLLSNTQKQRLKEDGTSVAHWLQSLSSFTAKIFKRYSHMDVGPICIYVAKQLMVNNAVDLIILRDLISEMAGLRSTSDLSEDQLSGCAGGPLLRIEALSLINESRELSSKVPVRLLYALDKTGLTYALPILMGQQRLRCIYNVPDYQVLLKLLANLADEVHQIMVQYLEFLSVYTTSQQYSKSTSSASDLIILNSLEPVSAFMLTRPTIYSSIRQIVQNDSQDQPEDIIEDVEMADSGVEKQVRQEDELVPTKPVTDLKTLEQIQQIIEQAGVDIEDVLPPETWLCFTTEFYITFWNLSLYDFFVTKTRYEKEIERRKNELRLQTSSVTSSDVEHRSLERKISGLNTELLEQAQHNKVLMQYFESRKSNWFLAKQTEQLQLSPAQAFVQHCLLPRSLSSPNDATFCALFLEQLHNSNVSNLDLGQVYEFIFGGHLSTTIFSCTEREAENLGRFMNDILRRLNGLSLDKAKYEAHPLLNGTSGDQSLSIALAWEDFTKFWYGTFHRTLWNNVKTCFVSKEYMHIRNVLIVLERMNSSFPYFKWIGKNVEKEVDHIIGTEVREDLKIRALGYKAVLKKQHNRWSEIPRTIISTSTDPKDVTPGLSPQSNGATRHVSEVKSDHLEENVITSQTDTTQDQITKTPPPVPVPTNGAEPIPATLQTSESQREAAKKKAVSLSLELRARQEKLKSEKEKREADMKKESTNDNLQAAADPSVSKDRQAQDCRPVSSKTLLQNDQDAKPSAAKAIDPMSDRTRATSDRPLSRQGSRKPPLTEADTRSRGDSAKTNNHTEQYRNERTSEAESRDTSAYDARPHRSQDSRQSSHSRDETTAPRRESRPVSGRPPQNGVNKGSAREERSTPSSGSRAVSQRDYGREYEQSSNYQHVSRNARIDRQSENTRLPQSAENHRSLASRVDGAANSAPRNAPDGPRTGLQSSADRPNRNTRSNNGVSHSNDTSTHPTKDATSTTAPEASGSSLRQSGPSTTDSHEPLVHPSRQRVVSSGRQRDEQRSEPSRATRSYQDPADSHRTASRRSTQNRGNPETNRPELTRQHEVYDTRTSRQAGIPGSLETRHPAREARDRVRSEAHNSPRLFDNSDSREVRPNRDSGETRRSGGDRGRPNERAAREEMDLKRRSTREPSPRGTGRPFKKRQI